MSTKLFSTVLLASALAACCPPKTTKVGNTTPTPVEPVVVADPPTQPAPPAVETNPAMQTAKPQDLAFPQEAFRAKQPEAGPPRAFTLPPVQQFTLANGITAYLVEKHDLPLVSLDLTFEGGSVYDTAGKEGTAGICMDLLSEGTVALDKVALSEALGDLASSVNSYASRDSIGVSMDSLSRNVDATFGLFAQTITQPGFRQADFDRLVKQSIEAIKQSKGSPEGIYGRVLPGIAAGAGHPFGKVATEASVANIALADCQAYATKFIKPQGAKLFVVGDMTQDKVKALFDSPALATWKGKGVAKLAIKTPAKPKGRIYFVNVPGAAQSQVALIGPGPKRNDKAYYANTLMSNVLGGGFTSRVNMNLREDKGYSYGARGGFNYNRNYGLFNASASVRTDSSFQSLLELRSEMEQLASGKAPVTAEELSREKNGATLGLPGQFATGQSALAQYRSLVYYGLPLDTYNKFVANIEGVTDAQVKGAAKKLLRSKDTVMLVIGDGNATMITRNAGAKKDEPMMVDGKPVTLKQALQTFAADKAVGPGGFVELNADGQLVK